MPWPRLPPQLFRNYAVEAVPVVWPGDTPLHRLRRCLAMELACVREKDAVAGAGRNSAPAVSTLPAEPRCRQRFHDSSAHWHSERPRRLCSCHDSAVMTQLS